MKLRKLTSVAGAVALALAAAGCSRTETTAAERANGVPDNAAHQGTGPGVPTTHSAGALPGSGAASGAGVGTGAGNGVSPATGAGMGTVSGTNTGSPSGSADSTMPATGTAAGAGMTSGAGTAPVDATRATPGGAAGTAGASPSGASDTPQSPGTDRGSPRSGDNKGASLGTGARLAGLDAARVFVLPLAPTAASAPADAQPRQEMPRPGAASMTITTGGHSDGAAIGAVGAGDASRMKSNGGAMTAQPATGGIRAVGPADRHFMDQAAIGGLFEVQAGKLAVERGSDALKEFGRMLVEDHGAADKELNALAASRSITLPPRLTQHQQSTLRSLSQKEGGKFDQQFVQEVGLQDHRSDIRKFENAAKRTKDPELKAFIEKTLPTLRKHREHAQQLAKSGVRSGGSGGRYPTARPVPQPGDKMTPQATEPVTPPATR